MSFEVIHSEKENGAIMKQELRKRKLRHCLEMCLKLKDRKILVVAYGFFILSLAAVLTVGHYAVQETTTSTIHTEPSIPTLVTSIMVFVTGLLFTFLVVKKRRCLTIITIILATASGVLSAVGAVHFGIAVSNRLSALSDCSYNSFERRCACSVVTSSSQVKYTFEDTRSCNVITKHLREVAYGMCGVYVVAFVSCFGAAVYVILLAHKVEIQKIKNAQKQECAVSEKARDHLVKKKQPLEEDSRVEGRKKGVLPWQQDMATQTGSDASCRHQCRHFMKVTVPDDSDDFVVNMTKSRDPPPPYYETVYT